MESECQFNAIDPDLTAFKQRGGKILQYHGWNDQQIAPQNSINYYESVVARAGDRRAVEEFYRLFMVPGMMHCQGGEGATDQFDKIAALEQWVERGIAPDKVIASMGPWFARARCVLTRWSPRGRAQVTRTMPLISSCKGQ